MRIFRLLSVAALAASTVAFFPAGDEADAANYRGRGAYGRHSQSRARRYRSSRYTRSSRTYSYRAAPRRYRQSRSYYTPSTKTYRYTPSTTYRSARSTTYSTPSTTTYRYTPTTTYRSAPSTTYYTPSSTYTPSTPSRYTGPRWIERKSTGSTAAPAAAVTSGAATVIRSVPAPKAVAPIRTFTPSSNIVYSTGSCFT